LAAFVTARCVACAVMNALHLATFVYFHIRKVDGELWGSGPFRNLGHESAGGPCLYQGPLRAPLRKQVLHLYCMVDLVWWLIWWRWMYPKLTPCNN